MGMITKFDKFLIEGKDSLLDILLDKISDKGIEFLNSDELNYLSQVSKNKVNKDLEKKLSITGEYTFICQNKNIPDLLFHYLETEDFGDMLIHKGDIKFDGNDYFGAIFCNNDGDFDRAEFYLYEQNQEIGEVGTELYAAAEGLEHELDYFFEKEVCPYLTN
jgi:hypothetical protein